MRTELADGGWVDYLPWFVKDHEGVMAQILRETTLAPLTVRVFGKAHPTPRLVGYYGSVGYGYSGQHHAPEPITGAIAFVRDGVAEVTGVEFNTALVNYYRDGSDCIGAHADDEPGLGPGRDDVRVASVSLGARRRFVVTPNDGGHSNEWSIGGGDLLVMGGTLQRHCRHGIPRTKKRVGPRLSITFRLIGQ